MSDFLDLAKDGKSDDDWTEVEGFNADCQMCQEPVGAGLYNDEGVLKYTCSQGHESVVKGLYLG